MDGSPQLSSFRVVGYSQTPFWGEEVMELWMGDTGRSR